MSAVAAEDLVVVAGAEGYEAVGVAATPAVVAVSARDYQPAHGVHPVGVFGGEIDGFDVVEETDNAAFVSCFFQPFGDDAEDRTVDEDHVVALRFSHNFFNTLWREAEVISEGHVEDSLQVLPRGAAVGFVVDEVGVDVLLAGNLAQHDEVLLAALLATLRYAAGFLVTYD